MGEWVESGPTNASDIAAELGCPRVKGQVSKLAKRAIKTGKLVRKGREYALP